MYIPPHFSEARPEVLKEFIEKNPFGVLITNGASGLDANHIPFEIQAGGDHGKLTAHVARNNPVWQDVKNGDEVLVVFSAGDSYISPSWYPSKHEFHKQVPSWNYMVVHARGRIAIHDDERYVRGVVARLTRTHEGQMEKPWKMTDSPADYIDMMLKAIVGFEIELTSLAGKFKLSQNKEVRDIRSAGEALTARGETTIGHAMLRAAEEKEKSS